MKYGTVATPDPTTTPAAGTRALTASQTTTPAALPARMSIPFSFGPTHEVELAVPLALSQVRIGPLMICVGVKRFTGGRPLNP
jgi:hypothetical protein